MKDETNRVSKDHPFQQLDVLRQRRTHQERLVHFRHVATGKDLLDVVRVTVGEDEVGFVYGERFEGGEGERLVESKAKD